MKQYVMALGTFDGVHLGHQSLVHAASDLATQLNIKAAAFTFTDLPREKLTGIKEGQIVLSEEKERLLLKAGAEQVFFSRFDAICQMSPAQFVDFLVTQKGAAGFVCGADFRFGKNGAGDAATLAALAEAKGFPTRILPFVRDEAGDKIASCRIREWLQRGEMEKVTAALGHRFSIEGRARHGKGLAHQWGTPTVNIPYPDELVKLRFGVYHTQVYVEGKAYVGITNVGLRPTFDDGDQPNIETFILDAEFGDISKIRVEFLRFLRPEKKFPDQRSLQDQILKDINLLRKEVE